jgi:hypothetical protein
MFFSKIKFLSNLEFNVETWLVVSICWVSDRVSEIDLIRIRNLEWFINWHFIFIAQNVLSAGCKWNGKDTTVSNWSLEAPFEENRLFSNSWSLLFEIVLDFGCRFISVNFTLPSKSHVVFEAVRSEPNLTPLLVFPG